MLTIGYCLLIVSTIRCCIAEEISYRITFGTKVSIADYPFVACLRIFPDSYCGGSVISNQWILTAAHCLEDTVPKECTVITETDQKFGGIERRVESIHSHHKFDPIRLDYDCGLLKLKQRMVFNRKLQPIRLPRITETLPVGYLSVVLGFGSTLVKSRPSFLQKIIIPVLKQETCKECYSYRNITERMFCAGYLTAQEDACQGDSGGPLILMDTNLLVGIVSFGRGCGRRGKPSVYTFVANYEIRNFIKRITGI